MSRGAQLAIVYCTAFVSASFGVVAAYCAVMGEPVAVPFVIAVVLGLIALACLTEWVRRALLPVLTCLFFAAFAWRNIQDGTPWVIALVLALPALLCALAVTAYVVSRRRHPVEHQAVRLLQTDNAAGAVTLLEEELRAEGLLEGGWNVLSLAYGTLQKWPEALKAVEEAIALGGPRPGYLNNKGMFLWKSGQAAAALPLLEEAARRQPNDSLCACNLGLVRADLGQRREAAAALRRAEQIFASQTTFGAARKLREGEIEGLRRRVAAFPAGDHFQDEGEDDSEPADEYRGRLDLARLNLVGWLLFALATGIILGGYVILLTVFPLGKAPPISERVLVVAFVAPVATSFGFFQLSRYVLRRYGISIYRR